MTARMLFGVAATASLMVAQTLLLEDVIDSVHKHYPPLLAALAETEVANGELLAAEGRFDTAVYMRVDSDSLGYYSNRRADLWVEQPLAANGMSLYSGYRVGAGEFAPYDGKLDTRSMGEFRAGFKVPLLRDRSIDGRRADLAKAQVGRRLASLTVDQQRLAVLQAAIHKYWTWVANGHRLAVTREVLEIAEARQTLLKEGVQAGQIAAVDAVDNERTVLQRRSQMIESQRAFQAAAIELSLFWRGADGNPIIAGAEQVPPHFPEPRMLRPEEMRESLQAALLRRPELQRFSAQREQMEVDVRLAENLRTPRVDLFAGFTNESGSDGRVRRGPQELKAGIAFELPLQNRTARGREAAARARLRQFDVRMRFVMEQIQAEVRDAVVAAEAARERLAVLIDEVRVSRAVEEAERSRYELGEGTLFVLNLREQATADAAIRRFLAEADYRKAIAAYESATGALLDRYLK